MRGVEHAILCGLAAFFAVRALRLLDRIPLTRAPLPFARWTAEGVKPWACDLCMSAWSTLGVVSLALSPYAAGADLAWWLFAVVRWWASAALCLWCLTLAAALRPPPPPPLPV